MDAPEHPAADAPPMAPPGYAAQGYNVAPGYPPPGYSAPGYVPPAYGPPEPPSGRRGGAVWIVLAIVALFLVGGAIMCVWFSSRLGTADTRALVERDAIALIHLEGVISGASGGVTGGGDVTPEVILSQLKQAEDDARVKAVLLRIDSPGGTVAASEEIATEVARSKKPIVVSIGDVGASGGYMVASQADWIVASPGSDVGSIGVILQVANLQGLLDKLGVKFAVITAGEYKDIGSPYRSLTASESALLQEQVDIVYKQFIDYVAAGRKMPVSEVRALATGLAWVGTEAKKLGLVDEIGSYNDAVKRAARLGKISGEPEIIEYGPTTAEELLRSLFGVTSNLQTIAGALTSGTNGSSSTPPLVR